VNAFIVDLKNKPGELAKMTEAIAAKGIDIPGVSAAACSATSSAALLTSDEAGTRQALDDGHWTYRPFEVVRASLADRPGSLAKAARRLANAGVNIDAVLTTGMSGGNIQVGFVTDHAAKATEALGDIVLVEAYSR
jgi:hypothetical protein